MFYNKMFLGSVKYLKHKLTPILQGSAAECQPQWNRHFITLKFNWMSKIVPKQTISLFGIFLFAPKISINIMKCRASVFSSSNPLIIIIYIIYSTYMEFLQEGRGQWAVYYTNSPKFCNNIFLFVYLTTLGT